MSIHDVIRSKKSRKIETDSSKHYPNKDEAALLRKLIQSTGLSEEEIRKVKKYRKMLSEAQKQGQKAKTDPQTKWYQDKIKEACKETGLVPQHPKTIEALERILNNSNTHSWLMPWNIRFSNLEAKSVIKRYAK